jgi:uncharacterized protein (DUF2147 family)
MINPGSILFATLCALILTGGMADAAPKPAPAANPLTAVSGFWYTEGHEGGIQLYACDGKICGRFYWMKNKEGGEDEDGVSRDTHNSDPALRRRPLCHMEFMSNFTPADNNRYEDGYIYNPRDGQTYMAVMTLLDHDNLKLRGYLFFEFLGESQIWTRATSMPDCAASD